MTRRGASGILGPVVQHNPPDRPPSSRGVPARRRPERRQRGFLLFVLVTAVFVAWAVGPGLPLTHRNARGVEASPTGPPATVSPPAVSPSSTTLPAKNPIKHIVFLVKENRTFNHYFGAYGHGAVGATEGGTLTCTGNPKYFPLDKLSKADLLTIVGIEDRITDAVPDNLYRIARYWEKIRTCLDIETLPDELQNAGIHWKYYADANQWQNALQAIDHIWNGKLRSHVQDPDNFITDIQAGRMPQVSWLIPPEPYNEHPGSGVSVCAGENWTVQHVNAVMHSRYWRSTAIVVVWDDFGGFYDPLPPPHYDIMGLGPRTPALIISPYTKHGNNPDGGYVDHTDYEFSSVLAFIEQTFGLGSLTKRDAHASPLAGAFDFEHPNFDRLVLQYRSDCPYGTTLKPE